MRVEQLVVLHRVLWLVLGGIRLVLKILDDVVIRLGHPSQRLRRQRVQVRVLIRVLPAVPVVPVLLRVPVLNQN